MLDSKSNHEGENSVKSAEDIAHCVQNAIINSFLINTDTKDITHFVAVSAGVDSAVLAHALNACGVTVHLLHVNHHRMAEADAWQSACIELARSLDVPITISDAKINNSTNIEARLRDVRYKALFKIASGSPLWLAHHQDDQIEGFFLRLMRGSGSGALVSLRTMSQRADTPLIRPFLRISKNSLVQYAHHFNLKWLEDQSNEDFSFKRNIWRHELIPQIKRHFPQFEQGIIASLAALQRENEVLEEVTNDWLNTHTKEDLSPLAQPSSRILDIRALLEESTAKRSIVLRGFIKKFGFDMPPLKRIDTFIEQLNIKSEVEISLNCGTLRCWNGWIYVVKSDEQISNKDLQNWEWSVANNDYSLGIDGKLFEAHQQQLTVEFGVEAKRVTHPNELTKHTKLKKLLPGSLVPPWQRRYLPCVLHNDQIIYVPSIYVHPEWQAVDANQVRKLVYIG